MVKPADPLLLIVPKNSELMVEAMVLNRDAGFIREGQSVEVKLEAFPFTRYGIVKGQVERISRDSVQDEKLGLVYPAGEAVTTRDQSGRADDKAGAGACCDGGDQERAAKDY